MMNKFTFHPVGQGLFYSGQLDCDNWDYRRYSRYNFIFDCGSLSGQEVLYPAIDKYLTDLNKRCVNLCVISHLDKDHYNGLYYLIRNKHICIDKILLPYLPDNNMLRFVVLVGQFYSATEQFNDNDYSNLRHILGLYGIGDIRYDVTPIILNRENLTDNYKSGEYQCLKYEIEDDILKYYWQIECYNKTLCENKWQELTKRVLSLLRENNFANITDMLNFNPESIARIAKIYGEVFKNKNVTSIVMKHHPLYDGVGLYPNCCCELPYRLTYYERKYFDREIDLFGRKNANISVLTGDMEFDESLRQIVFGNYNGINVLQIPHHGSYKNFESVKLPDYFESKSIISFGLGNRFGHPNKRTIEKLKCIKYNDMIFVHQNASYEYYIMK